MYCSNCGKDAGDSKFCPECGKAISNVGESNVFVPEMNKKKKGKKIILVPIIAVLIIIALLLGKSLLKNKEDRKDAPDSTISTSVNNDSALTKPDTTEKVSDEVVISEAKGLAQNGNYIEAIEKLKSVSETDEVSSLIKEYADSYLKASDFGCYWEEDEISDYHWAYADGQDSDVHSFSFCIYIHQNKTDDSDYGFHLFSSFTGYSGSKEWIFPNTIRIKGDKNEAIDLDCTLNRKSEMKGRTMYEWVNINITKEQFDAICKTANESSKITVRFIGYTYHQDYTLTPEQIEGIKTIEKYGEAFVKVYGTK